MYDAAFEDIPELPPGFCDLSGFAVFSHGAAGHAHAVAHWLLDRDRFELGRRYLARWLDGRTGAGSEWVHLHWHMAVFELELGRWQEALDRFRAHVLPAVPDGHAHTDAPELLWRLALDRPAAAKWLPWAAVRDVALAGLRGSPRPFAELHHLLALAGAGDSISLAAIEAWISLESGTVRSLVRAPIVLAARGLLAYARGEYASAARWLAAANPHLGRMGGSRAQNLLFERILQDACGRWERSGHGDWPAA